ncbi:PfkB family carbohydrate kinase [Amycolatopsis methanolica]|uniref:PfkB family carbohydrate kinase n=1 Tax=Amycolatopsis methanolica TaxID=1814 RepID=UPI00343E41D2
MLSAVCREQALDQLRHCDVFQPNRDEALALTGQRTVEAIDTTGAGDVFAAAFVLGTLSGWTPAERVRFATLRASLSVRQFGGSLAAPGWHDIATWWREADEELRQDYAFVVGLLPSHRLVPVRRASATLAAVSERG